MTGNPASARTRALDDTQRLAWLRLIRSENVGPRTFAELVNHYGGAAAALEALGELARRGGRRRPVRIAGEDEALAEIEAVEACGAALVGPLEPGYPPLLRQTHDRPPLLVVRGRRELASRDAIAIVGARNASALGMKMAGTLAGELGEAGLVVASGLARGIDAAAHRAGLATGTVAVLAGGIDVAYPPQNEDLQAEIAEVGLLISESPPGTQPRARDFPRRNRIISGLARGVAVIEAARRSGSLITARLALEQGREVFAVPGTPLDPRSEGANRLIREGATLIRSAADVLEALQPMLRQPLETEAPAPAPAEDAAEGFDEPRRGDGARPGDPGEDLRARVVSLLGYAPTSVDELVRAADAPAGAVAVVLLELELAGRLVRHGGQLVSLAS